MISRILSLEVTFQRSICYFVENDLKNTLMIDCGAFDDDVQAFISRYGLNVTSILLTHGHFDHICGLKNIPDGKINVYIGENEIDFLTDASKNLAPYFGLDSPDYTRAVPLKDGEYDIDGFTVKVIDTPGHTKGSVSYLIENHLFSGDTLFYHNHGRCDLPTGDYSAMKDSLKKLLSLDGKIIVHPGHGDFTTVEQEKIFYNL